MPPRRTRHLIRLGCSMRCPTRRCVPMPSSRQGTGPDGVGGLADAIGMPIIKPVVSAPLVINGRLKDVGDGTESVRLAWPRDDRWQHHMASRIVIADARKIVELAGVGVPVTSCTANDTVRYLAAYEQANLRHLPRARVSKQMGWQGERGDLGFLWGRTLIRAEDGQLGEVDLDALDPEDWAEDGVAFHGADAGDEQLADGYHAAGTIEGWRDAVQVIAGQPCAL